jgi:aminopeptidase N
VGEGLRSPVYNTLDLTVYANPQQLDRGRSLTDRAADIARFYQSVIGDSPYRTFTLALIENTLPGGHSPGYFAALNQPTLNSTMGWRTDPANFEGFPEFFLAHEMAHQWWGQAVGWQNYHEQWLSEGFAQYFAGLYAKHYRGDQVFTSVLRQWRKWSLDRSDQGPVYLGYRLGHIRNDGRVFRALVYNKGAAVLHMLRRLIGDEAFFRGIRRFYGESRFRKAGTEDLRRAMEAESDRPLERFFERWIYGSTLPRLTFAYHVESSAGRQEVVLHFEQLGEVFDIPVTVTLQYADSRPVEVLVPITDRIVDQRVVLHGSLRSVDVGKDDGSLVEMDRKR